MLDFEGTLKLSSRSPASQSSSDEIALLRHINHRWLRFVHSRFDISAAMQF
jgi:hypothetical protein